MKKLIYILVAFSTLIVGIAAYYTRSLVIPVSLCDAKQGSMILQGNDIHVRGFLAVNKFENEYFAGISNLEKECSGGAAIGNTEELQKDKQIKQLFDELSGMKSEDGAFVEEVEVVGELTDIRESGGTSCFMPPYRFKVKSLKQIAPIKFFNNSEIHQIYLDSRKKLEE
jgi:hypothetical protein